MTGSAAEIIHEKGGPAAFASKVGKQAGAVRAWKHRNRFPREVWPEIVKAFPDISFNRLVELENLESATGDSRGLAGAAE